MCNEGGERGVFPDRRFIFVDAAVNVVIFIEKSSENGGMGVERTGR